MPAQTSHQHYEKAVREYRAAYGALKSYCERMEIVRSSYPGNDLWMSGEYDAAVKRLDRAEAHLLAAYDDCHPDGRGFSADAGNAQNVA